MDPNGARGYDFYRVQIKGAGMAEEIAKQDKPMVPSLMPALDANKTLELFVRDAQAFVQAFLDPVPVTVRCFRALRSPKVFEAKKRCL
jgi:hypothetical protein